MSTETSLQFDSSSDSVSAMTSNNPIGIHCVDCSVDAPCSRCQEQIQAEANYASPTHKTDSKVTKPYKGSFKQACQRCGGDGVWKGWFKGMCFRCGGCGTDPTPDREWVFPATWTAEQVEAFYAKKEAQRCARAAKKDNARLARMEAAMAQYASVKALRESWLAEDGTPEKELWYAVSQAANDIMWKAFAYPLTEAQVALLDKQVAQYNERQAAKAAEPEVGPAPTGSKVFVCGTVVSVKWHENRFGSTCKLTVKMDNGSRVWFTRPSGVDVRKGDVVNCLLATVEASEDDATFAFGKRPTQFVITEQAEEES